MTTTATALMTAEQFFDWVHRPENAGKHFELERGRAVEVPRPGELHGATCHNVDFVLGLYIRQRDQGCVFVNDTGVIWERDPDTVRGPDVFYYSESKDFFELNPKYTEHVPTLVVEVLSPNDRMGKVNASIAEFLRWGVSLVWLVDPEDRTVTVYRPDRAHTIYQADQELTGDEVLPDFRCRVADFFYMPGKKKMA
jgi:Uma2 family endonuclease